MSKVLSFYDGRPHIFEQDELQAQCRNFRDDGGRSTSEGITQYTAALDTMSFKEHRQPPSDEMKTCFNSSVSSAMVEWFNTKVTFQDKSKEHFLAKGLAIIQVL